ncbi:hypothetical protein DTO027B5_1919 [Paecilomyces variotii]|nr:hypothetical protein DTO169C6_985 [Paecilomyces variotii]KAJ9327531.1 hypothetical protein DTO027B3_1753 [Paecilomyces variotii]KAJ9336238.1 hypothetical protein DTO027B5_1919 [Paecilomyces variotii]
MPQDRNLLAKKNVVRSAVKLRPGIPTFLFLQAAWSSSASCTGTNGKDLGGLEGSFTLFPLHRGRPSESRGLLAKLHPHRSGRRPEPTTSLSSSDLRSNSIRRPSLEMPLPTPNLPTRLHRRINTLH